MVNSLDLFAVGARFVLQDQRRLNREAGLSAAAALDEDQTRRALCARAHRPQPLRLDAARRHGAQKLREPLRPVDDGKAPAPAAEIRRRAADVLERAEALVARGGAVGFRRRIPAARGEIRRVRDDEIKAPRLGEIRLFAQIAAADLGAVGERIQREVFAAGFGSFRLNLDAEGRGRRKFLQQQHGQNARAAAEIGHAADLPAAVGEIRQQHTVRAEGKARGGRQKARAGPEVIIN